MGPREGFLAEVTLSRLLANLSFHHNPTGHFYYSHFAEETIQRSQIQRQGSEERGGKNLGKTRSMQKIEMKEGEGLRLEVRKERTSRSTAAP